MSKSRLPELPTAALVTAEGEQVLVAARSEQGHALINLTGSGWAPFHDSDGRPVKQGASMLAAATGNAVDQKAHGYFRYRWQLSEEERENVKFRAALCHAMSEIEGREGRLTEGRLNTPQVRREIEETAGTIFGQKIGRAEMRGGRAKLAWPLPKGRTLLKYLRIFKDEGAHSVSLQDRHRLKGNRSGRVTHDVRLLMTEASKVWLTERKPSMAVAHAELRDLIESKNRLRRSRGLKDLQVPSLATLRAHIMKNVPSIARHIARNGEKDAHNKRGPGSTDVRAQMLGELVEIDECKLSIIVGIKEAGQWEELDEVQRARLVELEDGIRKQRIYLVLMLDVATRMPLAWVLTDQPRADATMAAFGMATRSKEREQQKYGCLREAAPAVGLAMVRNDNGPGLRNSVTKTAMAGIGTTSVDMRTHRSADKPFVERMFGTLETELISRLTGYTGNAPGALPAYDAVANGKLPVGVLYEIITRYLTDIYPHEPHFGFGMFGRTPYEVMQQTLREQGMIPPPSPHDRRVHLGKMARATPNDEGIRAFGLPYQSTEFQKLRDLYRGKWAVYLDPDDLRAATVLIEGYKEPIEAQLTATFFADLDFYEAKAIIEECRRQNPRNANPSEHHLMEAWRAIKATNRAFEGQFGSWEDIARKFERMTQGIHLPQSTGPLAVAMPGSLADDDPAGAFTIGEGAPEPLEAAPAASPNETSPTTPTARRLGRPETKGKMT